MHSQQPLPSLHVLSVRLQRPWTQRLQLASLPPCKPQRSLPQRTHMRRRGLAPPRPLLLQHPYSLAPLPLRPPPSEPQLRAPSRWRPVPQMQPRTRQMLQLRPVRPPSQPWPLVQLRSSPPRLLSPAHDQSPQLSFSDEPEGPWPVRASLGALVQQLSGWP